MKARNIALGGVLVALTTIVLYLAAFLPISTLAILTIASSIIPICIIRSDVQTAIFVYIASSLIAFFLVPINISSLYFIFFGVLGKEKLEILFKLLFFNVVFIVGFLIMQNILGINVITGLEAMIFKFFDSSSKTIAIIILWIIAQPVFLIYDYAMTMIITFYMERIHKKY